MEDSVRLRLAAFPRERTWLLPALLAAQETEGWLSSEALTAVAEHVRVSPSETCAIATDYSTFRRVKPGSPLVRVCAGLSCRLPAAAVRRRRGPVSGRNSHSWFSAARAARRWAPGRC